MAYAEVNDIEVRANRIFTEEETKVCEALLEDSAVMIDAYNSKAAEENKKVVTCRMVMRAIANMGVDVPIGATQGTMSALGYSQTWTLSGGSMGELYLSKLDKKLLSVSNGIGSHSPLEDM